jgi:hypothetical protein
MPKSEESGIRGHIPKRLSDDASVKEYHARDYIATGKSIYSSETSGQPPSVPAVPPVMLPPRARVDDASGQRRTLRHKARAAVHIEGPPRPAPESPQLWSNEVVLDMLQLVTQEWVQKPNAVEKAILKSAHVMFSELARRAEALMNEHRRKPQSRKTSKTSK